MSRPTLGRWILLPAEDADAWDLCEAGGSADPAVRPRRIARVLFDAGISDRDRAYALAAKELMHDAPVLLELAQELAAFVMIETRPGMRTHATARQVQAIGGCISATLERGPR